VGQIECKGEAARAAIAEVHQTAQHAQMWSLMTNLIQRRAELMSPDNAEMQARIALAADMACVFIITDMGRKAA
jgi:hypothetical protein